MWIIEGKNHVWHNQVIGLIDWELNLILNWNTYWSYFTSPDHSILLGLFPWDWTVETKKMHDMYTKWDLSAILQSRLMQKKASDFIFIIELYCDKSNQFNLT